MKILKISVPLFFLLLIVFVLVAPIGPLPGVLIGGIESEPPLDWGDTLSVHEITLEVPGPLPRVVIIWVAQSLGELYIVGSKDSGWVSMLGEGGPVRMRMDDKTYSLNGTLIETGWEQAMETYVAKYRPHYPEIVEGFPAVEEAGSSIAVFRLTR